MTEYCVMIGGRQKAVTESREEAERMVIANLPEYEGWVSVVEDGVCLDSIEPKDFQIQKHYYVQWGRSESRNIIRNGVMAAAEWMLCDVEGTQLYAEIEVTDDEEPWIHEDELRTEIERQARENYFEEEWLDFGN